MKLLLNESFPLQVYNPPTLFLLPIDRLINLSPYIYLEHFTTEASSKFSLVIKLVENNKKWLRLVCSTVKVIYNFSQQSSNTFRSWSYIQFVSLRYSSNPPSH